MASQTYVEFVNAVKSYLLDSGSTDPTKGKSNKQVVQHLLTKISEGTLGISLNEGSMLSYLSRAANQDPDSNIVSGGVGVGYWLQQSDEIKIEVKDSDEKEVVVAKGKASKIYEKDLYPLMELWLNQKGFSSKDTSNLKSGGRWGNPDIIGVERVDLFGAVEIDVASCEVKLGEEGWEQVIFEAISHKRFSNRSWFCYRIQEENTPLKKGMEYYAERYRVGLVQIVLSDAEVLELSQKKKQALDFIDRVIERVPALYDTVPLREQKDVIERNCSGGWQKMVAR